MTPVQQRIISLLFAIGLTGVLIYAGMLWRDPAIPALVAGGLTLSAAAPLLFLFWSGKRRRAEHPATTSALIGLGCVLIMVGVQRFGSSHQSTLAIALAVLVAWMLIQRYAWRRSDPS